MAAWNLKNQLRKLLQPLEKKILGKYYFSLQDYLRWEDRIHLLIQVFKGQNPIASQDTPEVTFFLYSKACERLLIPLLINLLQRPIAQHLTINLVLLTNVHRLTLTPANLEKLAALNCPIQTDYFSLIKACWNPKHKLAFLCLDHRQLYHFHKVGVDTIDQLRKFGVKTLSIQHGGTRADSVQGQATAAADLILIWGKRVEREMIHRYQIPPERIRVIGNPLHDRLAQINPQTARQKLLEYYPHLAAQITQKKIILIGTCLHTEYRNYDSEQTLYDQYIQSVYNSIDYNKILVLIKMHPLDKKDPNLYQVNLPSAEQCNPENIVIIEPENVDLDIYQLLSLADLLLTRCSTVAEEALLMGKKVVAFDLFEEGPSMGYKHLEEYGSYQTVYATPENALKEAIDQALFSPVTVKTHHNIEEDITYCLDGHSTDRGVEVILEQLDLESIMFQGIS